MTETIIERFRRARRDPTLALLEGFHPLKHALRFGAEILTLATTSPARLASLVHRLAPDLARAIESIPPTTVEPDAFPRLAPSPPREPVLAIARRPVTDVSGMLRGDRPIVLLEEPTHLPNVGACVRVAAAASAGGLLTTGPHDPWHAAALRGANGLHFALPVGRLDEVGSALEAGRAIVALHPDGTPLSERQLPARPILAFGSERRGLSRRILDHASLVLAIPMRPGVSSLNLATAVAVTLYCAGTAETST